MRPPTPPLPGPTGPTGPFSSRLQIETEVELICRRGGFGPVGPVGPARGPPAPPSSGFCGGNDVCVYTPGCSRLSIESRASRSGLLTQGTIRAWKRDVHETYTTRCAVRRASPARSARRTACGATAAQAPQRREASGDRDAGGSREIVAQSALPQVGLDGACGSDPADGFCGVNRCEIELRRNARSKGHNVYAPCIHFDACKRAKLLPPRRVWGAMRKE